MLLLLLVLCLRGAGLELGGLLLHLDLLLDGGYKHRRQLLLEEGVELSAFVVKLGAARGELLLTVAQLLHQSCGGAHSLLMPPAGGSVANAFGWLK